MRNLLNKPEEHKFYLLALFHEEQQINKVYLFATIKEAQQFYNKDYRGWIAYVVDLKYEVERPFIKLN